MSWQGFSFRGYCTDLSSLRRVDVLADIFTVREAHVDGEAQSQLFPRDVQRVLTHQESGLKASFLTLLLPEGGDISDPLPVKSPNIERACEAPLAESASRCASRGFDTLFDLVEHEVGARPI